MPLVKLDLSSEEFSFLKPLVDSREKIVEEHRDMKESDRDHHFALANWSVVLLQCGSDKFDAMSRFPTISKFSDNLPKKYLLAQMMISEIGYGSTAFHEEKWTELEGFHRIHIPLANFCGCSLDIVEDNDEVVNYTYGMGDVYNFENAYNMHMPSNFNDNGELRLMILLDIVDTDVNPDVDADELLKRYRIGEKEFTLPPPL